MRTLELGSGPYVGDLIPRTHAHLRVARVFFPFEDREHNLVSWSRFIPADRAFPASTSWAQLLEDAGKDPRQFAPACGILDEATAASLRALVGDLTLTALSWRGYWHATGSADYQATTALNATESYISRRLTAADLQPGTWIPEFAWDDDGQLAWGAPLYPDSIAVAASGEVYRRVFESGLCATGARDDDVFPPSSGD